MQISRFSQVTFMFIAILSVTFTIGCGKSRRTGDVVGKVTLNGKAPNIDGLAINFLGPDGLPVTSPVAKDGTYRASGVTEGSNKICFSVGSGEDPASRLKSSKPTDGGEQTKDQAKGLLKSQEEAMKMSATDIPSNWLKHDSSNLSTNVVAKQENTFNIDIK